LLEEQLLAEFVARLRGEAEEKKIELGAVSQLDADTALAEVMLGYLEDAGFSAEYELCPHEDDGGRQQCRIIGFSLAEGADRLELFTAAYFDAEAPGYLPNKELVRLAGRGARFFEYAGKADFERFSGSPATLAAARRIHDELRQIEDVRVHVLTNARARERAVKSVTILERPVGFSVWDIERLYRASGEEVTRERIEIDFQAWLGRPIACLEMKPPPAEYQTFLVILPGDLLARLYQEYGPLLFERNVRSFLQAKGKVNKGIRDTLKSEPERFLAYNNGLTATADEIEVGSFHGETVIKRLKGLQIVNGAQTTASIHRAAKLKEIDPRRVAVAMKLTRVDAGKLGEFVPLIAQYANTQNPVQLADLSANSDFHVGLARLAEKVWCPGEDSRWFYERTRGAYQVALSRYGSTVAKKREFEAETPKSQHFSKTDLAKYCMSWWLHPHIVSRGAQKNFNSFMEEIRERYVANWQPDEKFFKEVVALAIIWKAAQNVVRKAKLESYGANVVTYMVAKLAHDHGRLVDFDALWDVQEVSPELGETLIAWAPLIHRELIKVAGARNVTEVCKKEECWEHIRNLRLAFPSPAPPEFKDEDGEEADHALAAFYEQADLIGRCTALDGHAWHQLLAWASSSGKVASYDRKVANTLAGYADDGWKKQPSIKQARIAVRVLDAGLRAGVLQKAS
jgi:hypothetical protein